MRIKFITLILGLIFVLPCFGQNARLIEVQDKVKNDVSEFLEKFAPNTKYSVKVKIKPLRRKYDNNTSGEDLPFMEFQEDLVLDEWDDPKVNIYSLYSRIAEARISVYIEDRVKIQDKQKFKDALLNEVNLIPGRDIVFIESIITPVMEKTFNWKEQTEVLLLGVMLMIAVILGVGLNSLSKRIIPQQAVSDNSQGERQGQPSTPSMSGSSVVSSQAPAGIGELSGDLNIQDPSKINEVVGKKIAKLLQSDVFPTLNDMVIMEELLQADVASFSYLVYEFPLEIQKSIYQLGKGENWFKGFSEVGFPSKVVMISLDKMLRDRNVIHSEKFEKLLIHTWRLDKELSGYIKKLDKKDAFSLLYYLPKDISIPVARDCFPGAWGSLLEDNAKTYISDASAIQKLIKDALTIQPYFNYDSLQVFKNRKDLLKYLDTVEPSEEKEIYNVMGHQNDISGVRPPFYTVFELEDEDLLKVYRKFSMNDWALACFNIDRSEKERITSLMDEKEKYLFSHMMQHLDENPVLAKDKLVIRKDIAKYVSDNFHSQDNVESEKVEKVEDKPEDSKDNVA